MSHVACRKGFTLVEVLMTAVVLALGTILLHQTYLKLADLYSRYASGMRLQGWVHDRLWDAREGIVYSPDAVTRSESGTVEIDFKNYEWNRQVRLVSGRGLYAIRLNVSWLEGGRSAQLSREIYAFRKEL